MGTTQETVEKIKETNERLKKTAEALSLGVEIPKIYKEIALLQERISKLENGQQQSEGKPDSKKSNRVVPAKRLASRQSGKNRKVSRK